MSYPRIRIEGAILAPGILERLEEASGQRPADFGLDNAIKVKDEIARAWADAQAYWRIFQRKIENLKPGATAASETRQQWIMPLSRRAMAVRRRPQPCPHRRVVPRTPPRPDAHSPTGIDRHLQPVPQP